jgi:site-specific recombinase XerD
MIYLRLTVNGVRSEISTDKRIAVALWNPVTERARGKSEPIKLLNAYLTNLQTKIDKYLILDDEITVHEVIKDLKGADRPIMTLFEAYRYHIESMEKLTGTVYTATTLKKYKYSFNSIQRYTNDIRLKDLDYNFVSGYHDHMRANECLLHNSATKNIKNLYRVINIALRNDWLEYNPFKDFSCTFINPPRPYLTEVEIDKIVTKELTIDRLAKVRDIFVFQIYTGLSFIDMFELTNDNVEIGINGKEWIVASRKKNGNRIAVPLLPRAKNIIEKYRGRIGAKLLPVCSNQRFNGYLKEIADICGVNKNITSHIARHTFATTVCLGHGIPIETVSRLLGHTSLVTTQIYAKVTDNKVADDMQRLY